VTQRPDTHTRPLWRDHRFVTYWSGQTVSQLGDRVSELALPLIAVTTLHASPAEVGVLTAAIWAPNLLSVVVGAWVDQQRRRKRLLVGANLVQAAAVAALPAAHGFGFLSMWLLFAVALALGAGGVLYQTSYQPFFVRLVRRDQYLQANSLLSATRSASFIAGPALGGLLIQAVTAPVAMVVDAVSFVASSVAIASVRVDEPPLARAGESPRLWRRAVEGLRFLRGHPFLRATLGCSTVVNFFSFVASAVVILFASRTLGLDAGQIGLAFGLGAVGGLVGAVGASRLARRLGPGVAGVVGAVLFCAPLAFLPLASGPDWLKIAVLAAVEFVSSVGVMFYDINVNSIQTAVTPDRMRSRSAGAYATVNYGIRPLGALLGGLLAGWMGIPITLVVAGFGGCLGVVFLWRSPVVRVRRVEDLEPVEALTAPTP
jgi:predicted MFS family arabinose efflux permease